MNRYTHFARLGAVHPSSRARTGGGQGLYAGWEPAMDVYDRKKDVVIVLEMPGCDGDRIEVTVEKQILLIKGVRERRVPEGAQGVQQLEIPYGAFVRQVRLGPGFNADGIQAEYSGGFLTITVPRRWR